MALRYTSGIEIRRGDVVLYSGAAATIDFVADPLVSDPDTEWYVSEFGGGVMILQPTTFGSVFVSAPESDDHLELVQRAPVEQA